MPLSDVACRRAKPGAKTYKLADGGGLVLRVIPAGGKYWAFRYRFGGKDRELALGAYPGVSLADARARRDEARAALAVGDDPALARQKAHGGAKMGRGTAFRVVALQWHTERQATWTPLYAAQLRRRLEKDIFPWIGDKPVGGITTPQLLDALKAIQARGVRETTHRLKQMCGMVFRYAIAHGAALRDPSADLRGILVTPPRPEHFATLPIDELPDFMAALAEPEAAVGLPLRMAVRLLLYNFVRTKELIEARWEEIDLDGSVWIIPAARMKMRRDHIVPLARQSVTLFRTLRQNTRGPLVFPGHHDVRKPMSNNAILQAIRRIGYHGRMTGHGFRALAMTTLREQLDYPKDIIDMQLAHAPRNKIDAAYDRSKFLKKRAVMMQSWADFVDERLTSD